MSCFIAVPSLNVIPFAQCFGPFPGTGEKSMEMNRKKSSYISTDMVLPLPACSQKSAEALWGIPTQEDVLQY